MVTCKLRIKPHEDFLPHKLDIYYRMTFSLTTVSSMALQSLLNGLSVSITDWSAGACDSFVMSTFVSSLCPKSSVSMDGMVRRTSGNWLNWFPLRFSDVHCVNSSKLSGSIANELWDKSNTIYIHTHISRKPTKYIYCSGRSLQVVGGQGEYFGFFLGHSM